MTFEAKHQHLSFQISKKKKKKKKNGNKTPKGHLEAQWSLNNSARQGSLPGLIRHLRFPLRLKGPLKCEVSTCHGLCVVCMCSSPVWVWYTCVALMCECACAIVFVCVCVWYTCTPLLCECPCAMVYVVRVCSSPVWVCICHCLCVQVRNNSALLSPRGSPCLAVSALFTKASNSKHAECFCKAHNLLPTSSKSCVQSTQWELQCGCFQRQW